MRITYLGHAGLLVETAGTTVLCDPWFSRSGAFTGSWFPLPSNDHLAEVVRGKQIDYLYISHDHEDHLDSTFLASLPRHIKLIVPAFASRPWYERVRGLGFVEATFLRSFQEIEIAPGVRITMVHAPSAFNYDSALIIADVHADEVVVNLNDCLVDDAQIGQIRARYPQITAAFAQFSGATWFPFVYDFPADERIAAARRMIKTGLDRWRGYMRGLQPRWAVPFAGPGAFLDPRCKHYFTGPDSIFPTPDDLVTYLHGADRELERVCTPVLPGDLLDTQGKELIGAEHHDFSWQAVGAYLDVYANERAPHIAGEVARHPWPNHPLFLDFRRSFERLFDAAPALSRDVAAKVLFHVDGPGGGRWLVDFAELTVSDLSEDPRPREELCDYEFRFESRYVPALADYSLRWEDFLTTLRFRAWRPSVAAYNRKLTAFLRFARPNELAFQQSRLALASESYDDGSFLLETAAGTFNVQQYCPHMGQRLGPEHYDPSSGTIVCPRHGWTFRIPGGECLTAKDCLRVDAPIDLPSAV